MVSRTRLREQATLAALAALVLAALWHVRFFEANWPRAFHNLWRFLGDATPEAIDPDFAAAVGVALLETLEIAFLGTVLAAVVALPLSVFASRTFGGPAASLALRGVLSFLRTVPSFVWAIVFIAMVGLGPLPGALAVTLYSIGYLSKLYTEILEGVNPEIVEALSAAGVSRWRIAQHAAIPESTHLLLSQTLFVFEYNVRASTIVGLVGGGGIGFLMARAFDLYRYDLLMVALLFLLVLVVAVEFLGGRLRKTYLPEPVAVPA
ncbi:MAG TPA: phosphonate ABC transporter, permease protein PhnE [Candidatus Thermoplasmatota archaeon]|nr:phosphonate ABC transporter, permease protein PhnE [Candidatus Thermoplasmatota archaeon]